MHKAVYSLVHLSNFAQTFTRLYICTFINILQKNIQGLVIALCIYQILQKFSLVHLSSFAEKFTRLYKALYIYQILQENVQGIYQILQKNLQGCIQPCTFIKFCRKIYTFCRKMYKLQPCAFIKFGRKMYKASLVHLSNFAEKYTRL